MKMFEALKGWRVKRAEQNELVRREYKERMDVLKTIVNDPKIQGDEKVTALVALLDESDPYGIL